MRLLRKLSPFLLLLLLSGTLIAQAASTNAAVPSSQITQLQQQVADAKSSADNAWMLMCSALVLLMTGPGLALFYGGLVRKKNVLATMMQSFAMMALVTVLWAIIGYSLCFGSGNSFIGGVEHAFLHGVGAAPDADYAATIPQQTFMIYQLMFAIITPALISRRICRAHEVQRHAAIHGPVVARSLRAHGAYGVGQGRLAERQSWRAFPHSRLRRRHRRPHYLGSICAGLRTLSGPPRWFSQRSHAPPQCGTQLYRRVSVVGRLVRL